MSHTIYCPHCGGHASCDDSQIGLTGSCPHCAKAFTLQLPAPPPAPPVPPKPAPLTPAASVAVRETRAEFIARIRRESSYQPARNLVTTCQIVGAVVGGLAFVGSGLALVVSAAVTSGLAIGACGAGAVLSVFWLAANAAISKSAVAFFDMADTAIDQRK